MIAVMSIHLLREFLWSFNQETFMRKKCMQVIVVEVYLSISEIMRVLHVFDGLAVKLRDSMRRLKGV